jgi:hypothetical protein
MKTNGGADTNVHEDWHAMLERQKMDARGPGFEALADKLVTDLRCPRGNVRLWLHDLLSGFEGQTSMDEWYGSADPIKWLKHVLSAAEELEKLLQQWDNPYPSATIELADLRFKGPHLLVELARLISAAKQRLAETTEDANADVRRGRPPDQLRRRLVQSILQFYTECTGRLAGRSRRGPANRIVLEVCRFLGWKANSELVYGWIREAMTP